MRFHGIDMRGKFWVHRVTTVPAWASGDEGRLIYAQDTDRLYVAKASDWKVFFDEDNVKDTITASSSGDLVTENAVVNYISDNIKGGVTSVSSGSTSVSVTISPAFSDANYSVSANLVNTTDGTPSSYTHTITTKTAAGFTVTFSGVIDSVNYDLEWVAFA